MVSDSFAERKRRASLLVRRSPVLSVGAKLLWAELLEWCWTEARCWPNVELLAFAINASRHSISRWTTELKKAKLLSIQRQQRSNEYILNLDVPKAVCHENRGTNSRLRDLHDQRSDVPNSGVGEHLKCDPTPQIAAIDVPNSGVGSVHTPQFGTSDVPNSGAKYIKEAIKEREAREGKLGEARKAPRIEDPPTPSEDENHEGTTGRDETNAVDLRKSNEIGEIADAEGLIEDVLSQHSTLSSRRRLRGSLVGSSRDSAETASKSRGELRHYQSDPDPPERPQDVLELLRGEVEAKFGGDSHRGLPAKLSPKERTQIDNILLKQFEPRDVLAIVRVLVWDWEIARKECFPPRNSDYPSVENLVQYAKQLAPRISTGFAYRGSRRGAVNTYEDRYILMKDIVEDDDPW